MRCSFFDFLFPKITTLGNSGMIWIAAALVLLCTKKYRKQGIILSIGLVFSLLIGNFLLKNLVARPRPCWLDTSIDLLISSPTDYSFPSGHTLAAAISVTILVHINRKFGAAAVVFAALIAFSRLYLFVHFPTDVIAAALIGIIIGETVYRIGAKVFALDSKSL